ncbi:NAD(P)/FAD-dependent oxidoreductase [Kiloniella sp.]|uniref:NAD(P)/FAD-dependent oxidoreductase n=1 Tax=Kiloniella sp. TaxID=1938587 RepID=UPI003A8F8F07
MSAGTKKNILVVGSGIIGLCSASYLLKDGHAVTLVERDPLGDSASCGNAGAIAATEIVPFALPGLWKDVPGWLLDPLGPLSLRLTYLPKFLPWLYLFLKSSSHQQVEKTTSAMSAYLKTAFDDYAPLLGEAGLQSLLKTEGSLTVYKSEKGREKDAYYWDLIRRNDIEARHVSRSEILEHEPQLGELAKCGVYTPRWGHFANPADLVKGLAEQFTRNGGTYITDEIEQIEHQDNQPSSAITKGGQNITFDQLVICAGAWSARLAKKLGDHFPLDTERGYNTTLPTPGVDLNNMVLFAEDKFVATPMSVGLRIGGAVEFAGIDADPNYKRCDTLLTLAKNYMPNLNGAGGTKWMGRRPSTPDSVPVISQSSQHSNVHYAFGHGHLGITGGAVTGRTIADMVSGRPTDFDLKPFRIDRFN